MRSTIYTFEETMRKPFVAGNWKMNLTVAESRHLVSEMVPGLQSIEDVDKVICPPFTSLLAVSALLEGTDIGLEHRICTGKTQALLHVKYLLEWYLNCVSL
jgi:triosephosphate isomerase